MSEVDMTYLESAKGWGVLAVKVFMGTIVVMLGSLYMGQNSMLYHPAPPGMPATPDDNPRGMRSPTEYGLVDQVDYEERFVKTLDGKSIHVWKMFQPDSNDAPTLIYFHGNAGNMGFRLQNGIAMFKKCKINVVMMDYRGFGKSTGTPTEEGLNLDAKAVLQEVMADSRLKGSPLVPFGRSLGGAVAVALAAAYPKDVAAIVCENTFLSISRMLDTLMPLISFWPLKKLLLRIGWDSEVLVPALDQSMMFVAGDSDELVPHSHMLELHRLAKNSKHRDLYVVRGGSHNDSYMVAGNEYYVRLKAFMDRLRLGSGSTGDAQLGDCDDAPQVALPTMGTDFKVHR